MNKKELQALVLAGKEKYSQAEAHAKIAVDGLFESLDKLAALGFSLVVAPGTSVEKLDYPKMVYRDNPNPEKPPIELVVQTQEEEKNLGTGWRNTPEAGEAHPEAHED